MKTLLLSTALMLAFSIMTVAGCQNSSPDTSAQSAPEETAPAAADPTQTETAASDDVSESAPPSSGGSAYGLTKEFLITQQFTLSEINEANFSGERIPTLEFGDGFMVTGRICNSYRGQGELVDSVLTVKAIASTRMLCPGTGLDELETRFFQMLDAGAQIAMDGSRLTLKQGDTTLTFKSR